MITSIVLLIVGIVLFFVLYFLGCILGFVFLGQVPKEIGIANRLFYLIPTFAVIWGIYGIIRHLFF